MQKTCIGTRSLTEKPSFVSEFPEEVGLCCPQCGTLVVDKGQCLVVFNPVPSKESKTGFLLYMTVDCRSCGCFGKPPALDL